MDDLFTAIQPGQQAFNRLARPPAAEGKSSALLLTDGI